MAQKWDFRTREYKPYELPKGASLYEDNFGTAISCAQCGKKVRYGSCYTSRQIHSRFGIGYAVCSSCYEKEWENERRAKEN